MAFLLSSEGGSLLARLAAEGVDESSLLYHTTRLRRDYGPDTVAAALDLTLLRRRARSKFSRADEMFFTREALEQASAEVVSRYRAKRYACIVHAQRSARIADLCCGIGGDALALAAQAEVIAVDLDPVRVLLAAANARVYGLGDRLQTVCADVTAYAIPEGAALWADPARRVGGRRVYSVGDYQPPLSTLLRMAAASPGAGIKLSPGVDYAELDALLASYEGPHEVEIISVRGEAREAVLWLGALCALCAPGAPGTVQRRATLLPGEHTLAARPLAHPVPVVPVGQYLYEPDAAVIRAHLVEHLAQDMAACKIDPQIAYLTADALIETPFATAYRVEEVVPFSLKAVNRRLRVLDIGELVIKKRGFAVDPEAFRRRLRYGGGKDKVVLVLTRAQDRPLALICRPAYV